MAVWLKSQTEQRQLGVGEVPDWLSIYLGLDEHLTTAQAAAPCG